jgi:hypothetical protein
MQIVPLALRAVQFLLTLIVTALIGNVIHDAVAGNPASINFAMFVAILCWFAVLAGLAAAFMDAIPVIVALALDGIAFLYVYPLALLLLEH